jgi:hypothetical protein
VEGSAEAPVSAFDLIFVAGVFHHIPPVKDLAPPDHYSSGQGTDVG